MVPESPTISATLEGWTLYDYVSPGLQHVRPDDCFPHMRPGDSLHHPWKYLRRDVPHLWYVDERFPLMGFLNRDEATLLHNIALQFAGKPALEIGSWLGWSTCHLALAGVVLDVIDPAHDDPAMRASVEDSLARCGVSDRVTLAGGHSPEAIATLGRQWSLFFIDGDHEGAAPLLDTLGCLPFAADDCAFVFHDLASPMVAEPLRRLQSLGFQVVVYQTAQLMGLAWRGRVTPVAHTPDPQVAWQLPLHLNGLPIAGVDLPVATPHTYRQFRDVLGTDAPTQPSVCIVTNEVIGPFKNGGIGTSMTGLAELLASNGLRVTVLYTGGIWSPDINLTPWRKRYAELGIELDALTIDAMNSIAGPLRDHGGGAGWLVYRYLTEHRFDVVHFNDCCGEGGLSLVAKKLGVAFSDSLLVVALHSPSRWVLELNQTLPTSLLLSAYHYGEQLSLACADVVWGPSRYLLDWVAARDYELPAQTFVQPYAMPSQRLSETPAAPLSAPDAPYGQSTVPQEIVFFGRLEERKGLRLFCNALQLLRGDLAEQGITVTFLGKPERCAGLPSLEYIERRAAEWGFPVKTMTEMGRPEAVQYLQSGNKLAVMPSPFDNSPCTVYEALALRIPFLAARTGGIPELIDETDHEHVLFDYATESLRDALRHAIEHGGWIAKPARPEEETRHSWLDMHAQWRHFLPSPRAALGRPLSVAAIIDHQAGARLDLTLQSIAGCPSVSRLIILNRSGDTLPVQNINLLTEDAEALTREMAHVVEDAVLLIHAGVTVVPEAFAAMVQTLGATPVDGLMPAGKVTTAQRSRVLPPLGGSAAFSLFEGVTFTGALLVRNASLRLATEGRVFAVESPFMGLADFCVTRNDRIWPYPEPVTEREESCRIDVKSPLPARVAAYGDASPTALYYMLANGYGAANRLTPVAYQRQLALATVELGLTPLVRLGSWALRRLRRWRR